METAFSWNINVLNSNVGILIFYQQSGFNQPWKCERQIAISSLCPSTTEYKQQSPLHRKEDNLQHIKHRTRSSTIKLVTCLIFTVLNYTSNIIVISTLLIKQQTEGRERAKKKAKEGGLHGNNAIALSWNSTGALKKTIAWIKKS